MDTSSGTLGYITRHADCSDTEKLRSDADDSRGVDARLGSDWCCEGLPRHRTRLQTQTEGIFGLRKAEDRQKDSAG